MSRGLQWLLGALALLVVGAGVAWWLHTYERVEQTLDAPRTGEARINPLFALKVALQAEGVRVHSRRRLELDAHAPGPRDTVVLYGDPRALGIEDTGRLLAWVDAGGHLVVRTPEPRAFEGLDTHPLWNALRVRPDDARQCAGWQAPGQGHHVEFCGGRRFQLTGADPRLAWGDLRDGFVFARIPYGAGSVDVLADMDFMTTDQLDEPAHAYLAAQVLAPNRGEGAVHLIFDPAVENFWLMLLRRHWPAWAPLLLALLGWLWMRTERFGPLLPGPGGERRSLLEHIAASGELLHRYGYGHLLYEAVREAFLARLRRRDPEAAALTGEPQYVRLAERFGVSRDTVRDALATPAPHDRAAFRARIATLVRLRSQL